MRDVVEAAREVDLVAVREVAALVQRERHQRVARLHHRRVDGHVRLRSRVRLDVRVLRAEQLLRAVDRELLDLVDHLAAAVVAAAGIALGVLVRRHRADGLEHGGPREVLGGDQLDLPALALELVAEQARDLGVELVEPRVLQLLEGRLLRRHDFDATAGRRRHARQGADRRPAAGLAAPAPVRSITVDGTPGSSPASTIAPQAARISSGISSHSPRIGTARQVRARRGDDADRADDLGRGRRQVRDADTDARPTTSVYGPGRYASSSGSVETRHRGDERLDVGGEQRDRLRAVAALDLVQDVLVLGQRAQPVDGVGRKDHRAARAQRGDRASVTAGSRSGRRGTPRAARHRRSGPSRRS